MGSSDEDLEQGPAAVSVADWVSVLNADTELRLGQREVASDGGRNPGKSSGRPSSVGRGAGAKGVFILLVPGESAWPGGLWEPPEVL